MVVRAAIRALLGGVGLSSTLLLTAGLASCDLDRSGLDFGAGGGASSTADFSRLGSSSSSISRSSTGAAGSTGRGSSTGSGGSTASSVAGSTASTPSMSSGSGSHGSSSASSSSDGSSSENDAGTAADATSSSAEAGTDAAPPQPDSGAGGPCGGGWVGVGSDGGNSATSEGVLYGRVVFSLGAGNAVTALRTTLTVPDAPPAMGSVEVFPSLVPNPLAQAASAADLGSIQPTLAWGPTCLPSSPNNPYGAWSASGDYVDNALATSVCQGGDGMDVKPGDDLAIDLALDGTVWDESITNARNGRSVTFEVDVEGEPEVFPTFEIASNGQSPVSDIVFSSTTITMASPEPTACQPTLRGPTDSFSTPLASPDGQTCCLSHIVLRARGVPATTTF